MEIKVTVSDTDVKILSNDISGIQEWVQNALDGKVDNCWSRMREEWVVKLMNDPEFTDPIPSNKEEFVNLILSRPNYFNRVQRNEEAANSI